MAKIYLPDNVSNNQCAVVVSSGHIRVYSQKPNGTNINNVSYKDYYITENYIQGSGTTNFNNYTSYQCLNYDQFTTDYWYRGDIWQSLICYIIIAIIGFYLPFKLLSRMFGRWLKL